MKAIFAALAIAAVTASQGAALSCLRPDPARAFQAASDAPSAYVVLLGQFAFDVADLPAPVAQDEPVVEPVPVNARFVGNGLTLEGFTSPQDRVVTLEFSCTGAWCGNLQPEIPVMAFARKDGDAFIVDVDPCGAWIFPEPSQEMLADVIACLRGSSCQPAR